MGFGADRGQLIYLLHDTRLALRERDVATRLVGDELDLDLATLPAALVVVVIVAAGGGARAFYAPISIAGRAVSGMIIEVCWGGLIVLIGNVGHFVSCGVSPKT